MWLLFLFVLVPIFEIALFIQVGGLIGLWPTLGIVILTAFAGTTLMRTQGALTINRLQTSLAEGRDPADPIAQGALILVAAVLLLTPGFFTDTVGLLLLVPAVRAMVIRWLGSKFIRTPAGAGPKMSRGMSAGNDVVEGEFTEIDDTNPPGQSGWTQR